MKFKDILKRHTLAIIVCSFFTAVHVVAVLLAPVFIGNAIDNIIEYQNVNFQNVKDNIIKLLICVPTAVISQYTAHLISVSVYNKIVNSIRCVANDAISRLSLADLDKINHGDLIMRISLDAQRLGEAIHQVLTVLFAGILTVIGTLLFMLKLSPIIALLVALLTPFSIVFAFFIAKIGQKMLSRQVKAEAELSNISEEYISNLRLLKLNNYTNEVQKKFSVTNDEIKKYGTKAIFISAIINPGARLINGFVYVGVCLLGALLITKGTNAISIGTLSIFLSYAFSYAKPFNEITGVINELQAGILSNKRLFQIINYKKEEDDSHLPNLIVTSGNVEFKNVSFSYTDQPLMKNFNLKINAGEQLAVIGKTGSGKTTIISLLMRFYEIQEGQILIDGVDIYSINRQSLRENIGMVLQDTWIFKGTIKQNISYANENATDQEIINSAKKARIDSFIQSLKDGYDTVIDPLSISQGQAQLISLARLFLKTPKILILDEATSSIDALTEQKIQQAFNEISKNHTTLLVAHRLNTIKNANQVLNLSHSK